MTWFMILSGSVLIMLALYRVIRFNTDRGEHTEEKLERYIEKKNLVFDRLDEENQRLEKKVNENLHKLRRLNTEMGSIINELSWKEKSIKRSLETLRSDIGDYSIKQAEGEEEPARNNTFEEVLNKTMGKGQNETIPDKYLEIFKLHDLGMSADEIAEEMDIGVRETEIIFKLYGKGADNAIR
ncbi:MAG: hypothetical protein ACLFPF_02415 [Halanaerobiales bacterium]